MQYFCLLRNGVTLYMSITTKKHKMGFVVNELNKYLDLYFFFVVLRLEKDLR